MLEMYGVGYFARALVMSIECLWTWPQRSEGEGESDLPQKIPLEFLKFKNCQNHSRYYLRKDCFQNKSKFITEDHFTKHIALQFIN